MPSRDRRASKPSDVSGQAEPSADTRRLADSSRDWLMAHEKLSGQFISRIDQGHPALWFSEVMTLVEKEMDLKCQDAVDLGCLYVIECTRSPFGKIHKSNILVRLKRNRELIKRDHIARLASTYDRMMASAHPPRESRELGKLLKALT